MDMKVADGGNGAKASLHERIRSDIAGRILSGEWPPGHRIPYEHDLMAAYGCARMTVSKALASLAAAGLIERRRRAGSFVRRPTVQSAVLEIPDIRAEILRRGLAYGYELLRSCRRRASPEDQALLDAPVGAEVLALRCRHLADGQPFALESRRIALGVVPDAAMVDFAVEPPGSWLLQHVPWTEALHGIAACNADPETARLLAIPPGTACLVVDRQTWRAGEMVTAVRVWFPGDRQRLTARFTAVGP
jgi:GntR family histidine utilization transcriptional repressor